MNWGAQTHLRAEGVDLPLWCTALAVTDGSTTALIVELDLLQLTTETTDRVRQDTADLTDVPVEQIRVSFSHTHSGPSLGPGWTVEEDPMVPAYVSHLAGKVAGTAWEALRRVEPARAAAGTGSCDININRRERRPDGRVVVGYNPEGFVDREVKVMRIDRLDGEPLATIVNYACHPTIMAHENRLITPDYPGVVRRVVEGTIGGRCLFLQGATGNIGPVVGYTGEHAWYHRLGRQLGLEAARVASGLETRPVRREFSHVQESGAPLAIYEERQLEEERPNLTVRTRSIALPTGEAPPADAAERAAVEARETFVEVCASGNEDEVRTAGMTAKRAAAAALRARTIAGRTSLEVEIQVIRIGDTVLVSMPGEPFAEIGVEIKQRSPFGETFFSGYSNGSAWYLPTAEAFEEGGYEIGASFYSPAAAGVLVQEVVRFLEDVKRGE